MVEVFMTLMFVATLVVPVAVIYGVWILLKRSWQAGARTRRRMGEWFFGGDK